MREGGFPRPKVLVVDDEEVIRRGCERILSRSGYPVSSASAAEEALRLLEAEAHPIVLLDLKMPGVHGTELLREIRQRFPRALVIVITGYATVENAVEAMKEGAYDFLAKPFSPDQLRLVVERAAERLELQRRTEQLLRERERTLRDVATEKSRVLTILESMADGVIVTDEQGVVVLHNPAALRLLGHTDPMVGRPLEECLAEGTLAAAVRQVMREPDTTISQELRLGEEAYLRAHVAPVRHGAEVIGSVAVLQDISQLKALERMRSDFVAMVVHELKSPLSTVMQQLAVVLQGLVTPERQLDLVRRSRERLRWMAQFIDELLDLSRIESGGIQEMHPLDLADVLQEALELIRPQAHEKGIELRADVPAGLPLQGDRQRLQEVFVNLLSNAVSYTPSGGRVELRARVEGPFVRVEVSDTGQGIAPEDLPRIFDRFYRGRGARGVRGSGLGLSIVKAVVEAHLGEVRVRSQVGKGSTFTVLLPARSASDEPARPAPPA